jgi:hypothetical protein
MIWPFVLSLLYCLYRFSYGIVNKQPMWAIAIYTSCVMLNFYFILSDESQTLKMLFK